MKDLSKILFGFTIFALIAMTMLWWRDVAITEKVVYRPKVITIVDTTTAEAINAMWLETVEDLIDSLSVLEPDTLYLSKESETAKPAEIDTIYLPETVSPWRERILRLVFRPPTLNFTTTIDSDTTKLKRFVYSDIPWGFMVYPGSRGNMLVQSIEPPLPPIVGSGYNWGIGIAWPNRIVPAVFGEYYIGIGRMEFTGLINISTVNLNVGLYFRWR